MIRDLGRKPPAPKHRRLTVDPGVRGTGVCLAEERKVGYEIIDVGVFKPHRKGTWAERVRCVAVWFEKYLWHLHGYPSTVYIEYPAYFETNLAAAQGGDLVKLAAVFGTLYGVCVARELPVEPLPVNTWKGQMGKKLVDQRIYSILGNEYPEHISDAVGMHLYLDGHKEFNE